MVKTGKRLSRKDAKKRKGRKVYTCKRTWNIVMRIKAALRERLQIPPLRCGMTQKRVFD